MKKGDKFYVFRLTGQVQEVIVIKDGFGKLNPKWWRSVECSVPQSVENNYKFDYFDKAFNEMKKALKKDFEEKIKGAS